MGAIEISVPRELPLRADGAPIGHLSASSLELLYRCPERWRRRYIALERPPSSGAQLLGSCVDEAVAAHFRARLSGGGISEADALDVFHARWAERLRDEPVVFAGDDPAGALLDRGAAALSLYLRQAAPALEPEAVQRRVEFRLGPELSWSVIGYPDLETRAGDLVDLKVKARHLRQAEADASLQATLYLLARQLEGRPAPRLVFHSLRHAGAGGPSLREVETSRAPRRLNGLLARIALAASLIAELSERYGPAGPWPLSDPESWACSARFCPAFASCPGGAGL